MLGSARVVKVCCQSVALWHFFFSYNRESWQHWSLPLKSTWFEYLNELLGFQDPAARTTKDINTKQYYHLLPINCAVVMSSVTKLSLGFPGCFFFFFGQVLCRWYNYSVIPYLPSNNITSYFNSNDFWSWWQIVLKWPKVFIAAFYWFLC